MQSKTLLIDELFRGPESSANGGYACGRIADLAAEPVRVTLRLPPPLGVPLAVGGFFAVNERLHLGLQVAFDDLVHAGNGWDLGVLLRWYQ